MGYNGYKNYETWNVCLWIGNDEGLHELAASCDDYGSFTEILKEVNQVEDFSGSFKFGHQRPVCYRPIAFQTPDMVAWNDSAIDRGELANFWQENFPKVGA